VYFYSPAVLEQQDFAGIYFGELEGDKMDEKMDLFQGIIIAINVGVQDFGSALEQQGIQVVYVDWSPPAGGDQEMIELLDQLF